MITQKIELDLVPGGYIPQIHVNQYDRGLRSIEVELLKDGEPFSVPEGVTAAIQGKKPSGTGFSYEGEVSGGTVVFDCEGQMTNVWGTVRCVLLLRQGDGVLGTGEFALQVQKSAVQDCDVYDRDEYKTVLDEIAGLEHGVAQYAQQASQWSQNAAQYAQQASQWSQNSAQYAQQASQWAQSAEQEAQRANEAVQTASSLTMYGLVVQDGVLNVQYEEESV
ncbi:MAG: BppU family phage baseplate upper protein [Oscillospiraceae bacterium]|nr:BppU family phage baseplate upper protein [Oscillospiraceae bacterium]